MDYAESVIEKMNLKYRKLMCPNENEETEEYKILKNQLKFTHSNMLIMKEYED